MVRSFSSELRRRGRFKKSGHFVLVVQFTGARLFRIVSDYALSHRRICHDVTFPLLVLRVVLFSFSGQFASRPVRFTGLRESALGFR